jgi:drug/metabolite transporter (DMT)-like permease
LRGTLAYTLWNATLRTLSSMESSVINNTMLFRIAVLAWVFLGERLTLSEAAGIGLAVVRTLIVQFYRRLEPGSQR